MPQSDVVLRTMAEMLDGLEVAMCVFDRDDGTLLWNRSFLRFFPEHVNHVHAGEPYCANLRRFYQSRLGSEEMASIDRYIDEGIARHRGQQRPFTFKHRDIWLKAASLPLPDVGRVRLWSRSANPRLSDAGPPAANSPAPHAADDTALFEHVGDGVMLTSAVNRVTWVNEHFLKMYGLPDKASAIGRRFEDVYDNAWREYTGADRVVYEGGLATLIDNMRFEGAPFELPLPGARWVRVVEQRRSDRLLGIVAERMQGAVRDADLVGRMGGDEFAIFQENVKDPAQAVQLAQRALHAVQQPIEIEGHVVHVGLSVGIALHPDHGSTTESLMRNADAAMYLAKGAGGGRIGVFDPGRKTAVQI